MTISEQKDSASDRVEKIGAMRGMAKLSAFYLAVDEHVIFFFILIYP